MKNLHVDPRENAPIKYTPSTKERAGMLEAYFESKRARQAEVDRNLAILGVLGPVLKKLKP